MVRKFKLRNKTGLEFDLMREDAWLYQPTGLGWGMTANTVPVGNSYYVTEQKINLPEPSGTMVFHSYEAYQEFLEFIQVGDIVLCYMPISTWRYLRCFVEIDKSEISYENKRLMCPITFHGVSQWYENSVLYKPQQAVDDEAKVYADEHNEQYAYEYVYEDATAGGILLNGGVLSSYWQITFVGPTINPEWRLYVNNELTKSGKINATILSGHRLVINGIPSAYSILEYDSDGELYRDRYGDSDWDTERFFVIPSGESTMVFTDSSQDLPNAFLEVYRRV